ncbi:DUF4336 domain-containing protein [Notoacmeibacter marinus]|uniref:DUF4336 domain-containing protein n=1 Tax=Notoacmeibacter marinus TaxID=1876515 RepID=A0A231V2B7_9HYPH|nr:DUF4336 domain-containing protein [Notoacmeibacter marinus]OXT02329.1 DUF4336 domain-containing protein [Notoacmeibacter marinus]
MTEQAYEPYAPLNTLKPFAEDIWIVDGPEIRMNYLGLRIPFPTRMTVVRLPDGSLWIHSPIAWNDDLGCALAELGPVRHIVAPNTLHYWYVPDWHERFPEARTYGPADLQKRARRKLQIDETLAETAPPAWQDAFEQCLFPGTILTEIAFFHRPSATLILTDLIENFEPERIRRRLLRWAIRLAGPTHPDGKAPFDMRWNFIGRGDAVRAASRRLVEWAPERIVFAHGRCYESNGLAELKRAFRWAL